MLPLRVGLVGTGYAAKLRAETLQADPRSQLIAVAGHSPDKTAEFGQTYAADPMPSWIDLVQRTDLDLVIVANVNRDHGTVVRAALQAGKHVVVEYPLSLDVAEAEELVNLAQAQSRLLHVEHIELLSGIHVALAEALPEIGTPFSVRYSSVNPQQPAPHKWTYQFDLFGFPLIGALSRLNRLLDLFGPVESVSCQARFLPRLDLPDFYTTCICSAHLRFSSGLLAELVYGKGEALWKAERLLEVQGDRGALLFEGDQGTLVQPNGTRPLETGSRRGLFAKDTQAVLDHLTEGKPLYIEVAASLYALKVADAARRSAELGQAIAL